MVKELLKRDDITTLLGGGININNIQQEIKHIRQKELIRFKRVARATSNGTLPFLLFDRRTLAHSSYQWERIKTC